LPALFVIRVSYALKNNLIGEVEFDNYVENHCSIIVLVALFGVICVYKNFNSLPYILLINKIDYPHV